MQEHPQTAEWFDFCFVTVMDSITVLAAMAAVVRVLLALMKTMAATMITVRLICVVLDFVVVGYVYITQCAVVEIRIGQAELCAGFYA